MTEAERLLEQARRIACALEEENARLTERVRFLERFVDEVDDEWVGEQ